jgi:hypothetical protein
MTAVVNDDDVALAMSIIQELLGKRWTWPPVTTREKYPLSRNRQVILSGRPVSEVTLVEDGRGATYTYTLAGHVLKIGNLCFEEHEGFSYPTPLDYLPIMCEPCVYVTYTYGNPPPGPLLAAINSLAQEFASYREGEDCRLPERITSVSRQGVSWTILDPQDFLENGQTGIYEVDLALSLYGPRAFARARVFTPSNPPPLRLEAYNG